MPNKIKKKSEEKNAVVSKLPEKVKEKLGISFEIFTEAITKDENFENYQNIIQKRSSESFKQMEIRAKTERDYQYIGINNHLKLSNMTVSRIKRFLQKRALNKVVNPDDILKEWISPEGDRIEIPIYLSLETRPLSDDDNLEEILEKNQGPVYYSLTNYFQ